MEEKEKRDLIIHRRKKIRKEIIQWLLFNNFKKLSLSKKRINKLGKEKF